MAKGRTVFLISAWNANEAFAALKELAAAVPGSEVAGYANPGRADEVFPGFAISGDKNPNRKGMQETLGIDPDASLRELAADKGKIATLVLVHNVPGYEPTAEMKAALDRSENVVLLDFAKSDLLKYGNVAVALPTLTTFEKSGTFVNKDGVHQKFLPVMEPVNFGRNEVEIFNDLARELRQAAAHANGAAKVETRA
jgi:predicted molibdopterin-dependent oxidoreductase YjgC